MINQQLREYVSRKISEGKTKDEVRSALLAVGWEEADIDEALNVGDKQVEALSKEKVQAPADDNKPEPKADKHHKLPLKVFLFDILSFSLGALVVFIAFMFLAKPNIIQDNEQTPTGFQEKQASDERRVTDLLKIQTALEKYYDEHKSYPISLDVLRINIPKTPSGSKYSYAPIGSPAEAYTLNAQIDSIGSQDMVVEGGFLTLKNMQGQK